MNWKFFRARRDPVYNEILDRIKAYDNSDHKSMVHTRLDARTVLTLNHLKMATDVDVTKLVAFSVSELLRLHPELKITIKKLSANT